MSKAEKTKQFIVERTASLFNTKGYAGTSLSDMTDATGLTKGSIYGNFKNKDEVAVAAFDHNLKKVRQIIAREMDRKTGIKEKLLVYIHVYENFLSFPFPEGGCPILNTAVEADDTHPMLRKRAAEAILSWKDLIIDLLRTGIATKEISPSIDIEQTALTLIATIEGGIMISKLTGKMNYRKQIMGSVEKMIKELSL
jgi:AcrR family transcriptional regulator